MTALTSEQMHRRDEIMGWILGRPSSTPKQKRAKQRRAANDTAFKNEYTRKMKAAEVKDAKTKRGK